MNAPATKAWDSYLGAWKGDFEQKNAFGLAFEAECHFAKQQILRNNFTTDAACRNPGSLHDAILNVAAVGISLNPALKHAYLVPRDGAICLDISYRGLIKIACSTGAILGAKAELVHGPQGEYPGDQYCWKGPFEVPQHDTPAGINAFHPDRINGNDPLANILGGYCVAVIPGGVTMVEQMSAAEIFAVRESSKAFTSGKPCPWTGRWSGQMGKKTLVKRASNSWPQTAERERLDHAIEILNQHEGLRESELAGQPAEQEALWAQPQDGITAEQATRLRNALNVAGITEESFCQHRAINLDRLEALPSQRFPGAMKFLQQKAQGAQQ